MGAQPEGQVGPSSTNMYPEGALEAEADVDEDHELLEFGDTRRRFPRWPMPWLPTHQRRRPL